MKNMTYACPTASNIIFNVFVHYMFESGTSLLPFLTSVCSLGHPQFLCTFYPQSCSRSLEDCKVQGKENKR